MSDFIDPSLATDPAQATNKKPQYFSVNQILAAAFLGGPIAGLWLLAANFKLFGENENAFRTWLTAWLGSVALIIACLFLPDNFPSAAIALPITLGIHRYARQAQAKKVEDAAAAGTPKSSNWRVAGICVVSLIAFVGIAVLIGFAQGYFFPETVPADAGE